MLRRYLCYAIVTCVIVWPATFTSPLSRENYRWKTDLLPVTIFVIFGDMYITFQLLVLMFLMVIIPLSINHL